MREGIIFSEMNKYLKQIEVMLHKLVSYSVFGNVKPLMYNNGLKLPSRNANLKL